MSTISPNMGLTIPTVGVDTGPSWATSIDASLSVIDGHSHVAGSGVPITPSAININADLPFGSNNATNLRSLRLANQTANLSLSSDLGCIYEVAGNLWYNNGSGGQVQLTSGTSVVGSAGTITGMVGTTASVVFNSASSTFVFQSATSTPGSIDAATLIIRYSGSYPSPSGNYIALEAPSSLATGFAFTLPNTLPGASNSFVISNTSGQLSYLTTDPVTLAITSSVLSVIFPSGMIVAYGGVTAPTGWFICNGSTVSRSIYATLFSTIGTAYGSGDGSTTFNLPDFRGQFLRGVTGASSNDPDASSRTAMNSGGNTGNNIGSVQASAFASHNHSLGGPYVFGLTGGGFSVPSGGNISTGNFPTSSSTGGNETRPINAYVNYIIKA